MLALQDEWVWDSWYLNDGERWHCWFLKAPKSIGDPALRHWHVSQGHATSADLIDWTYHGTSIEPSQGPAWDDYTTWTGSTVRGDDGDWHCFYTGASRTEHGKVQRIGHATSGDLVNWQRVGDGLCLDLTGANARHYESDWQGRWHDRAMRDPWVMADPNGDGWLMYFTARASGRDEPNDAGCIGLASSPDLHAWQLLPPVFVGGWGQLEVPQVFVVGNKWYCLFCMSGEHQAPWNIEQNGPSGRGNHYLMADNPLGPWRLAPGLFFDVRDKRYAARIVVAGRDGGLRIMGFKDGEPDGFGGYIMDPEPVLVAADGTLRLAGKAGS